MEIQTEVNEGLCTITINRPEKKNAMTNAMYLAFADALVQAQENGTVRVVLIKGQPDCFSAGNDMEGFQRKNPKVFESPVFRFLRVISTFTKPIVAQVEGVAVGIGVTLLLHCDLVYASDKAEFSLPFVKLGLCPEAASSYLLPMQIGYQRAAELLLLGEQFSALQAKEYGLVVGLRPAGEIEPFVSGQVRKLLELPFPSLLVTKRLLKSHYGAQVVNSLREEAGQFSSMLTKAQAKEAFAAFADKRKPDFRQFEAF